MKFELLSQELLEIPSTLQFEEDGGVFECLFLETLVIEVKSVDREEGLRPVPVSIFAENSDPNSI